MRAYVGSNPAVFKNSLHLQLSTNNGALADWLRIELQPQMETSSILVCPSNFPVAFRLAFVDKRESKGTPMFTIKAKNNRTGQIVDCVVRNGRVQFDGKDFGIKKFLGQYTKIA